MAKETRPMKNRTEARGVFPKMNGLHSDGEIPSLKDEKRLNELIYNSADATT